MPTSSVGKTESGVTLIELMVVTGIIALIIGIAFPSITSGIDSLRLNGAANGIVNFFNSGLSRAERRQQVVAITILKTRNSLEMHSSEAGFARTLELPDGVTIAAVLPRISEVEEVDDSPRTFMLYPGGAVPGFGIELINRRNVHRLVRVDPITGVPRVEAPRSEAPTGEARQK